MPRLFLLVCFVVALAAGCRKSEAPTAVAVESSPPPVPPLAPGAPPDLGNTAAVAEKDLPALLAGLTQSVRKYAAENQRVPKNLQELVDAGYLGSIPSAPPGRQFVIDKNLQVGVAAR